MARRNSRNSTITFITTILILVGAGSLAFWLYRNSISPPPKPVTQQMSQDNTAVAPHPAAARKKVFIYVTQITDNDAKLVPLQRSISANADPHKAAVEKLLLTNREEGDYKYLIPLGTKLLGLYIKDHIAYVNFSSEIKTNFKGGGLGESLLVNSIVHTLTQFRDVKAVQILVEGKRVESLGGHIEISSPVTGDSALLGTGDVE